MVLLRCFIFPGGQILALNHISLEGFTFDMAVRMIQNSPESVELTISQSKGGYVFICVQKPENLPHLQEFVTTTRY